VLMQPALAAGRWPDAVLPCVCAEDEQQAVAGSRGALRTSACGALDRRRQCTGCSAC